MKNRFSENLIELRKKNNLTQAQLAEKLNISAAAVSKWEKEKSMPDIDTAISLADYFAVSLDCLLSENYKPDDEQIEKISKECLNVLANKNYEAAANYIKNILIKYSKSTDLKIALAISLQSGEIFLSDNNEKEILKNEQEKLLLEVAYNEDRESSNLGKYLLGAFYLRSKDYGKAENLLKQIKQKIYGNPDELLCSVYLCRKKYGKAEEINNKLKSAAINSVNNAFFTETVLSLKAGDIESAEKNYLLHKKIAETLENSDFFANTISESGMMIAQKKQDKEFMLDSLENYIEFFIRNFGADKKNLFSENSDKSSGRLKYNNEILKILFDDLNTDIKYNFVRNEKRFKSITEKLKEQI